MVNAELMMLYWKVGYRINVEVLEDGRAEYGQSIIEDLAGSLAIEYGRSFQLKTTQIQIKYQNDKITRSMMRLFARGGIIWQKCWHNSKSHCRGKLIDRIYSWLKSGGALLFSVEHPSDHEEKCREHSGSSTKTHSER